MKQFEKGKQDDALSNLSDLLGELKDIAVDMGSEIERLVNCILFIVLSNYTDKLILILVNVADITKP